MMPEGAADLCVVIPALNEANTLPQLLRDLAGQKGLRIDAIVVDGASTDATATVARAAGARVVEAARGRAVQMNAGAGAANAPYLLFLHADSRMDEPRLLVNALRALREAFVQGHDRVAGHFALRFARTQDRNRLAWRYLEAKSALNRPGTTNGDQGLLLSRRYFDELGGFDEQLPFLEDQRLCARIRDSGMLLTLPGRLQTSGRRFERHGFHRQYLLMMLIMTMHTLGLRAFFEQSTGLYRGSHEAERLRPLPYFCLATRLLRADGWHRYFTNWRRIGRYGCANVWQLFFLIDVLIRRESQHPMLDLHDRTAALWRHTTVELLGSAVAWLQFHCVMLPWLWLEDRLRS